MRRYVLEADPGCEYAATININMDDIKEPVLCAPNDPDDARLLSEVMGDKIDEVFIGKVGSTFHNIMFNTPVSAYRS